MKISIITPTYNSMPFLPGSILSVCQQDLSEATSVQHRVMDGQSSDETLEWLGKYSSSLPLETRCKLTYLSEKDEGMYNVLNKAFLATDGDVVGHLNSDEQYLPGTLKYVTKYFEAHPDVDVLFGAVVVVDSNGRYICSRMPLKPQLIHTQVCHLCTFTASMFFRRTAIEKLEMYFDESFKMAGDADLVCRMLKARLKMKTDRRYFTVFVDSGDNLALSEKAKIEGYRMMKQAPRWIQRFKKLVELHHRFRKLWYGAYRINRFEYQFIQPNGEVRHHIVESPTGRWLNRL